MTRGPDHQHQGPGEQNDGQWSHRFIGKGRGNRQVHCCSCCVVIDSVGVFLRHQIDIKTSPTPTRVKCTISQKKSRATHAEPKSMTAGRQINFKPQPNRPQVPPNGPKSHQMEPPATQTRPKPDPNFPGRKIWVAFGSHLGRIWIRCKKIYFPNGHFFQVTLQPQIHTPDVRQPAVERCGEGLQLVPAFFLRFI